jgi:hypothetical protein
MTMWRAWVGFNASHSLGILLFGLFYGYLALARPDVLFRSVFLSGLGFCSLCAYAALAKVYWFSVPFKGVLVALSLYIIAVAVGLSAEWVG